MRLLSDLLRSETEAKQVYGRFHVRRLYPQFGQEV